VCPAEFPGVPAQIFCQEHGVPVLKPIEWNASERLGHIVLDVQSRYAARSAIGPRHDSRISLKGGMMATPLISVAFTKETPVESNLFGPEGLVHTFVRDTMDLGGRVTLPLPVRSMDSLGDGMPTRD
jgi:hypothetical protein